MDSNFKKLKPRYERVMPRVNTKSRMKSRSNISVTRHDSPSARVGGKPSVSNVSSSIFSELPFVLDDYFPEEKPPRRTFVVKPKKTLKSLEPVKPQVSKTKPSDVRVKSGNVRAPTSVPTFQGQGAVAWSDSHVRQCYSSRSHTKLQELKSEIKAYKEKEDLLKLRTRLYECCGLVLNEQGEVAHDKAVQAEDLECPPADLSFPQDPDTKMKWVQACNKKVEWEPARTSTICSLHFESSQFNLLAKKRRKLRTDAVPTLFLTALPEDEINEHAVRQEQKKQEELQRKKAKEKVKRRKKERTVNGVLKKQTKMNLRKKRNVQVDSPVKENAEDDVGNMEADTPVKTEGATAKKSDPVQGKAEKPSTSTQWNIGEPMTDATTEGRTDSRELDAYDKFSLIIAKKIKSIHAMAGRIRLMNCVRNLVDNFCSRLPHDPIFVASQDKYVTISTGTQQTVRRRPEDMPAIVILPGEAVPIQPATIDPNPCPSASGKLAQMKSEKAPGETSIKLEVKDEPPVEDLHAAVSPVPGTLPNEFVPLSPKKDMPPLDESPPDINMLQKDESLSLGDLESTEAMALAELEAAIGSISDISFLDDLDPIALEVLENMDDYL